MENIDMTTTDYRINLHANQLFQVAQEILVAKPEKAEKLLVKAIGLYFHVYRTRKENTPTNPRVSNPLYNMANCYTYYYHITKDKKFIGLSEKLLRQAIKVRENLGDIDSIHISRMKGNLGEVLSLQDRIDESLPYLYDNVKQHIEKIGYDEDTMVALKMYEHAGLKSERADEIKDYISKEMENFQNEKN